MENKKLGIGILAFLVVLSLIAPSSLPILLGLLVFFVFPGHLLIKEKDWLVKLTLSILVSMSSIALLYFIYIYTLNLGFIVFTLIILILEVLAYRNR